MGTRPGKMVSMRAAMNYLQANSNENCWRGIKMKMKSKGKRKEKKEMNVEWRESRGVM